MAASRYGGILGAPAIFDSTKWAALAELTGDQGAGKWLYREPVLAIDWEDGAIDIDTTHDLARIGASSSPDLSAE
jgi:CTP:molybdopterin cytidylyltransferase MocA